MSDTPISDSTPHNIGDLGMQIRRLERQLNAANERIKRLEEAGNAMASILNNTRKDWYTSDQCEVSAFNWNEAKEAKL